MIWVVINGMKGKFSAGLDIEEISSKTHPTLKIITSFITLFCFHSKCPATKKWRETLWRFLFYTVIYTYGTVTLMEQPWFWNHSHCWTDFPLQVMPDSTYGESYLLWFQWVKWGVSSRLSFGLNSAWGSIETTTIAKTHPTLLDS